MNLSTLARRRGTLAVIALSLCGCSASSSAPPSGGSASGDPSGGGAAGASSTGTSTSGGSSGTRPIETDRDSSSDVGSTGAEAGAKGPGAPEGGANADASFPRDASSANEDAAATAHGMSDAAATRADAGTASGGGNCNLPATVSFQKDVLPFLITSCSGTGCHVIDAASTMASGGYDHGYDWITAGAHASSCPETPTPLRFQVVLAVINEADPPSCSKSGKMPPVGPTWPPLTACQIATLQAWLDEPLVTQSHRADDTSPTTPYPMPPFN